MRWLLILPMMVVASCQTPPKPAAPATQTWDEFVRTRPDTFIQSYEHSIVAERQQLTKGGAAEEIATIRANVDAYLPVGDYTLQATGANAAVLRRLRVDSITNALARYGYRAVHFRSAAQAKLLVRAAAGILGSTGENDVAQLAPTVLVAELERVEDGPDGSSVALFRSVEPLKNAPDKGETIRISLRGPRSPSPYPPPPQPGEEDYRRPGRSVLFLAPSRSANSAVGTASDPYSRVTQPMSIDGDKLSPGYHSAIPETTLAKLRAAIRQQVCAPGFIAVGDGGGTSLSC